MSVQFYELREVEELQHNLGFSNATDDNKLCPIQGAGKPKNPKNTLITVIFLGFNGQIILRLCVRQACCIWITLKHFGRLCLGIRCKWSPNPMNVNDIRVLVTGYPPSSSPPQPPPPLAAPLWQWPEFMPPIIPFWHMYKHTWLHMYVRMRAGMCT